MKRKISAILGGLIVASAITGCAPATDTSTMAISASGKASAYANWLSDRLESDGITPEGEIIVGGADDAEAYGIDMSGIMGDGYIIRRASSNSETLIFGKTDLAVDMAVRYYANYCDKTGPLSVVEGEGYRVGSITIAGKDLSEYVIVCPEDADECQTFAADTLQKYLGKACGIYPEIVCEADGPAITLVCDVTGETYGDEAFNIKSDENGVTITGGRFRGCMYGVFEFLEEYIGYRFYYRNIAVDGEIEDADVYLYAAESVTVDAGIDHTEFPDIHVRDTYGSRTSSPALKYNGERTVRKAIYGGYGTVAKACHGYIGFISDYELHKMGYLVGYDYDIQPCYTDEYLNDLFLERVLSYCRSKVEEGYIPGKDFTTVDVAQHDIGAFCMCDNCFELYSNHGGIAGATVTFANMVAEAIEDDYPELTVGILAYYGSDVPPKNIEIHKNVYVSYCFYVTTDGYFVCGNHCIDGSTPGCTANKRIAERYDGWAALTSNLYVWYYPFHAYYMGYSSTYTYNLYDDIRYLADCETYGIFMHGNGDNISQTYNPGLINFYLAQRLMWDCDITRDEYMEMLKEYLYMAYGDGYEAVYEYIAIMEEAGDRMGCWCGFFSGMTKKLDLSYIKQNIDLLKELRDNAVRYARSSEQELLCNRMFASVYYYELVVFHTDLWKNGDEAAKAEYMEKLEYFLANYSDLPIGEYALGVSAYPPKMADIDMDQNPLEWGPCRNGGWDWKHDYIF